MRLLSTRPAPFVVLVALALGACSDNLSPTHPTPHDANLLKVCDPDCPPPPEPPSPPPPPPPAGIRSVSLPSGPLYVIGGSVSYSASLQGGPTTLTNVKVNSTIIQGTRNVVVTLAAVSCGSSLGTLPARTTCSAPLVAVVFGSAGLVPGPATFKVELWQGLTILSTTARSVTIDNSSQQVTSIGPGASPLLISAGTKSFTANLFNPLERRPDAIQVHAYIRQGSQRVAVGSDLVNCGAGLGVLPSGSCTTSSAYSFAGTTLTPGPAFFEVDLVSGQGLLLDSTSINVTLLHTPTVNSGNAASDVTLGVAVPGGFTVEVLNNNSSAVSKSLTVKAVLTQGSSVARNVGSVKVACGGLPAGMPAGPGLLCFFSGTVLVNTQIVDPTVDKGTLTTSPGGTPSSIEFWLIDDASGEVLSRGAAQFVLLHSAP